MLTHIKDKNLKSKLYWSKNLTLSKLLEVVSQYHDKDALILIQPEDQINRVELAEKQTISLMEFQGRCWNCNKIGHLAKDCCCSRDHVCESCGRPFCCLLPIPPITCPATQSAPPVMGETLCRPGEWGDEKKCMLSPNKRMARNQRMMHSASTSEGLGTLELHINDNITTVIVD